MALRTVELGGDQFDDLLRRAQCHTEDPTPDGHSFVKIVPIDEFLYLQSCAERYARLCQALVDGGIEAATIKVLVGEAPNQGDRNAGSPSTFATPVSITTSPKKEPDAQSWRAQKAPHPVQAKLNEPWRSQNTSRNQFNSGSSNHTASLFANSSVSDEQVHAPVDKGKLLVNSHDRRSILISGLPGYATLKDIAESVQGGIVLNMFMFLRKHEHVAHVTFVETVSAEAFVHYASNNEIKIRGKRVGVEWDCKQSRLAGSMAHKIYQDGARRNLLIRPAKAGITPGSICEDLEHIHQLKIVNITAMNDGILVSLNSISHAITARTCMSSRFKYKGTRIEFAPDECNEALPQHNVEESRILKNQHVKPSMGQNRFEMLTVDDAEDEDDE